MSTVMVDIDEFLPEIIRYAPNTSDIVAQRHIVSAARQICEAGLMWKESIAITITAPEGQTVDMGADRSLFRIKSALLGTIPLEPKTTDWLDDNQAGWDLETEIGTARYITQMEPNKIMIYPRQTGDLTARCVLKPARRAEQLPAFLLEQYFEDIGMGAGAAILTDPASKNPQLGLDLRQKFQARIDRIGSLAARGQQSARPRAKAEYF